MQNGKIRSINHPSKYPSMLLLAAAICLCPAAAGAGTLDFTDTATGTGALANENGGSANTARKAAPGACGMGHNLMITG